MYGIEVGKMVVRRVKYIMGRRLIRNERDGFCMVNIRRSNMEKWRKLGLEMVEGMDVDWGFMVGEFRGVEE